MFHLSVSHLLFCSAVLFLQFQFLIVSVYGDDKQFLTSPTGQRIELADISRQLTQTISNVDDVGRLIFEVTKNDHVLYSSDGNAVNLRNETHLISSSHSADQPLGQNSRKGPKVSYSYDDNSGVVTELSVGGVRLVPLDAHKYPGVFVKVNRKLKNTATKKMVTAADTPLKLFTEDKDERFGGALGELSQKALGNCHSGADRHEVRVAVAFDFSFCKDYGGESDARALIKSMISAASSAFEANTCLSLNLVHTEGTCDVSKDPYKRATIFRGKYTYLSFTSMRDYWRANRKDVSRDLTLFYVGYDSKYEYMAMGHAQGACSNEEGYAWINGRSDVHTAHRVARLLDASYDDSSDNIMNRNPRVSAPMRFSDYSAWSMTDFVDTDSQAACLREDESTSNPSTSTANGRCDGSFSKDNALNCDSAYLKALNSVSGSIYATVSQEFGKFVVLFEAQSGSRHHKYYITGYKRALSMQKDLDDKDLSPTFFPAPRATSMTTTWDAEEIKNVASGDRGTCCGHTLYIHIDIGIERHDIDGRGEVTNVKSSKMREILEWNINCVSCPNVYEPMSSTKKCPVCS